MGIENLAKYFNGITSNWTIVNLDFGWFVCCLSSLKGFVMKDDMVLWIADIALLVVFAFCSLLVIDCVSMYFEG